MAHENGYNLIIIDGAFVWYGNCSLNTGKEWQYCHCITSAENYWKILRVALITKKALIECLGEDLHFFHQD